MLNYLSFFKQHNPVINIEPMMALELKNKGEHLHINYCFQNSDLGLTLIACTVKGICFVGFYETESLGLSELKSVFPNAQLNLNNDLELNFNQLNFHLKCTEFQLKVWKALLEIPYGSLRNYGQIAAAIQQPNASRAVGTAIGSNPIAFIIPCHRVVQSTGDYGQYRWGRDLKTKMILGEKQ